jgi:Na+-transporting methylmalonyl-CoA/oxaloacetate decarboxylase gamma subunit
MLYGMGLVFLILAMLWGVIAIFQRIDRRVLAKEEEKALMRSDATSTPAAAISPDLMAAILVALDRYRQEEAGKIGVMKRYPPKEIQQGQARWVAVGRAYQLRSNIVPRRRNSR